MTKIQINNGHIIDPANSIDQTGSIYIADGKILSVIETPSDFTADQIIDAENQIICPGFIDLSVRLRDPGQSYKGTIQSETAAAASAGVTSLCLPPDTSPVIDTQAVAELIYDKSEKANYTQVYPIGALTHKLAGIELSSMSALKQAGCIAVSNATIPLSSLLVLRRAMEYASSHDLLVMHHPDEPSLSNQGCAHEGAFATRYGLPGIPEASESIAVAQCLELVGLTGCKLHFSQISCRRSVIQIQQAKKYGLKVTADVAIHQLHLTENDIEPFNSAYHVLPPFRTEKDKAHLRKSLANGTIDVICSDHQPHDLDAKLGAFPETEPGISSLETLLPLTLSLVQDNAITLSQGIASLTQKPADIMNLQSGA
ncbi:MAG: dihydroorotase, partial [Methylococcales bacterium]|nr:dihydroorotase [Methylococcales bacterium]